MSFFEESHLPTTGCPVMGPHPHLPTTGCPVMRPPIPFMNVVYYRMLEIVIESVLIINIIYDVSEN